MAKPFKIVVNKKSKNVIVYSTNYFRLEEYLNDVATSLIQKKFDGSVIFDLLLSNGIASNRFVELQFHNCKFDKRNAKVIKEVDDHILNESMNFYSSHANFLENSVLSSSEIEQFRNKEKV